MSIDRFYKFEDDKRVEMPRIYENNDPASCRIDGYDTAGDFKVIIHHGGDVIIKDCEEKGFHQVGDCYFFRTLKEVRVFCEGGWKEYKFTGEYADDMTASIYVHDHSNKWGTILANFDGSKLTAGLEKTNE
jgi:hypothetical protein